MYQAVASDLDGTLLLPNRTISLYTKEVLKRLTSSGIHFIFATGRHHIDVWKIRNNLEIKAYSITSNGARIHDTEDCLVYAFNLDSDIALDLLKIVYHHPSILTNVYQDNGWLINRHHSEELPFFKGAIQYSLYKPELLDPNTIIKIFFTCKDHKYLIWLEQLINSRWNRRVNVSFSTATCLEVTSGSVSKGKALQLVINNLGLTLKNCIAFGDGMNDAEMLAIAGKGCIMENASKKLKELYPELEVIGNNAENAVSHYLESFFFKKKDLST